MKKTVTIMIMLIGIMSLNACTKVNNEPDTTNPTTTVIQSEETTEVEQTTEVNLQQIVLYFSDKDLMNIYRIQEEVVVEEGEQIEKTALEAWVSGPLHEELIGLIDSNVRIESVKEVDGIAHVSFSKEIQDSNLGSSGELMLVEQISMILQQFGYEQTIILVEGQVGETLLGHVFTGDPVQANDPESYQWIEDKDLLEIVAENQAFQIYEPAPYGQIKEDRIVVRGLARVFEGTVLYELEDGHFLLKEGFTTASIGAPEWGEFEFIIDLGDFEIDFTAGTLILYEESAKDGSRMNELFIPVKVLK